MESSKAFTIPDKLPVIFLTDTVIHPYAVVPLGIQKEGSRAAIHHAMSENRLLVAVRAHETDSHSVGTLCRVAKQREMPDGSLQVIVQGLERVRLGKVVQEEPFYIVSIVRCPDSEASDDTTKAMQETALAQFLRLAPFLSNLPAGIINAIPSLETPLQAASVIATFLPMSSLQQQRILEANTVKEKLEIITSFLAAELTRREKEQQKRPEDQVAFDSTQQVIPSPPFQQKKTAGVTLGKDAHGKNVEISIGNRLQGFYCIGSNGTGKSNLLNQMIVQDIKAGLGVALLDPHGDLTDYVLSVIPDERIDDVILLDPIELARLGYYFGLNLFSCKDVNDPVAFEDAVERIIHVYEKIFGMSVAETPLLSQFVRHVARTFVETRYTMIEIPLLLLDKPFRDKVVPRTGGTGLFWKNYDSLPQAERVKQSGSTYDRIDSLVSNSIISYTVGQSQSTLNFREILDTGKILLCKLPGRMESFSSLLGAILIGQLLEAALSRVDIPEKSRRHFALYVDEFQNFATSDMARLLSEARKYRIASHLFHQYLDQLDDKNKGAAMQAGSLVVFRVNAEDAKILAPAFSLTPKPGDLIERPVRTYKQEVITHLLEKGHTSEIATEVTNDFLRPMQESLDQLKDKVARTAMTGRLTKTSGIFIDASTYYTFASHLREGMAKVNHILVLAMEKKLSVCSPQFQRLVCDAVITLRGYLEVQGGVEEVNEETIPLPPELYPFVEDAVRFECQKDYENPSKEKQENDKRIANEIRAARRKHLRENLNNWLIHRENYSSEFVDQGVRWRASTEFGSITSVVTWLDLLCNELAKDPIMVDSGKYEQIEGPKMTYADMANMIANEITQYPVGRARAKLTVTREQKPVIAEYILTTIRAQEGTKNLAEKKKRIIENTKRNYCKQRHEVEEEIRRRQEVHASPPPTRKHIV